MLWNEITRTSQHRTIRTRAIRWLLRLTDGPRIRFNELEDLVTATALDTYVNDISITRE